MKILITGVIGFIGYNVASSLLKDNHFIYGIDNIDNYYSIKIKKKRLENLNKNKNFFFKKIDLSRKKLLEKFFKKKKIDLVIHLAAQAGVRYSFKNPEKYIKSNLFGFLNLVLFSRNNNIKKIIYASSSSVYGDSDNLPISENNNLNASNIYAVTKKLNENTAQLYSKLTGIKFIGLRFFTVFGEWGRPDMLIYKIFKSYFLKKNLYLNNYGNHSRDFTYINDVVMIIKKLIKKKIVKHEIFNVCSSKSINIKILINNFKKKNKIKIKFSKRHKADILNTHGCNKKIKKFLKIKKFSDFYSNFYKTFYWYKINKIFEVS